MNDIYFTLLFRNSYCSIHLQLLTSKARIRMAPYSRPGDRVTAHDCSTVDLDTITPLKSLPDSDDDSGSMNSGDNGDTQMSLENDPKFFARVTKFTIAFVGLMTSYWTWTYMQDKIIMTEFNPTEQVPNGMFPSITFVYSPIVSLRLLSQ